LDGSEVVDLMIARVIRGKKLGIAGRGSFSIGERRMKMTSFYILKRDFHKSYFFLLSYS
jgi:hypothetical protein